MTRRQMLTALFGAAVLALPVAGCGHQPVQDEPGAELILRYAENQPEDYPTTQAALAFADLVAQRTNGRVKVLVYSGGELGAEQSVIQQMQFGGIDFSRVSLSQLAEYEPALSVLQLPYLYTCLLYTSRQIEAGRRLAELAPVEPEPEADPECCQPKKDAHPFVQKLTFQVKIAAAHRLGCIQVCRDDRPARIPQTEHPEEQHTGQPLLGEDQAHQWFGTERRDVYKRQMSASVSRSSASSSAINRRIIPQTPPHSPPMADTAPPPYLSLIHI